MSKKKKKTIPKEINDKKEDIDEIVIKKEIEEDVDKVINKDKIIPKEDVKNDKKKNNGNISEIISIITLLSSLTFLSYTFINTDNMLTNIDLLSIPIMFLILSLVVFISSLYNKSKSNIVMSILLIIFMLFYLSINTGILKLPDDEKLISYNNKDYKDFKEYIDKYDIDVEVLYEYSDTIEYGKIIRTNVNEGTYIKDIDTIEVTLSNGPDYDKLVIISSLIGNNIDDALKYLEENFLNNITINYVESDEELDTVIYQSINGEIRRNEELILNVSLSTNDEKTIEMIKLIDMNATNALLWLKRNGINYNISYEFSDTVNKDIVINQDKEEKTSINNKTDVVSITISNGKATVIPDFTQMTTEEATEFIINNNLKVKFEDIYSESIEVGKIISQSIEINTNVKEKTLVTLVISKGQIKMEEFNNINEFRTWAEKYNINYNEEYEYSNDISKGNVISYSYSVGEVVDPNGIITVKLSLGKAITIPNFIGKSKTEAQSICNDLGLRCSFNVGNYSNTYNTDVVYAQTRNSGDRVSSGSSISLTLSKGKPTTYNLAILQNWLSIGNADATINSLKNQFSSYYPGVNFSFKKVSDNTLNSGMISGSSPTKVGASITQGNTYEIWIVSN